MSKKNFLFSDKFKQITREIMTDGLESSPRGSLIKEVINGSIYLENPKHCISDFALERPFPFSYLLGETYWYLSGDLGTQFIKNFSGLWTQIQNQDGTINSNYGHLIFDEVEKDKDNQTQYEWVINSFKKDKDTRQAVIHFNRPKHQTEGIKDFPCTMYMQFLIRNDELIGLSYMRSNDLFRGFQFDIVWFTLVQQSIYLDLKETYPELKLGSFYHNATSLHIYNDWFEKADKVLSVKNGIRNFEVTLTKSLLEIRDNLTIKFGKEIIKMKENKVTSAEYISKLGEIGIEIKSI